MASTLSNLRFFDRISSIKINTFLSRTNNKAFCNNVKTTVDGASLQNAKQHLLQPKMTGPQATPIVLLNQFPVGRPVQQMMDTLEKIVEDPLAVARDGDEIKESFLGP